MPLCCRFRAWRPSRAWRGCSTCFPAWSAPPWPASARCGVCQCLCVVLVWSLCNGWQVQGLVALAAVRVAPSSPVSAPSPNPIPHLRPPTPVRALPASPSSHPPTHQPTHSNPLQSLAPVQGSLHAALHGAAWDGEVVACVVAGGLPAGGAGAGRLTLFFRSDSAEVVAHIQVRGIFSRGRGRGRTSR